MIDSLACLVPELRNGSPEEYSSIVEVVESLFRCGERLVGGAVGGQVGVACVTHLTCDAKSAVTT